MKGCLYFMIFFLLLIAGIGLLAYEEINETSGATSYIFYKNRKPALKFDSKGGISDLKGVNSVLDYLGLPAVDKTVPERSAITEFRGHRAQYHWEDYSLGFLTIERSLCGSGNNHYDCIWKVTIGSKKND